jgi:hypothetical protein
MALVDRNHHDTFIEFGDWPRDRTCHDPIFEAPSSIEAVGPFTAFGSIFPVELVNAGFVVEGIGSIELPPTAADVAALVESSKLVPYGYRDRTLVDTNVRNTWEIDASYVSFGPGWYACLKEAAKNTQLEMGVGPDLE